MTGPTYHQIERIRNLSGDVFRRRYETPLRPVVAVGGALGWKAMGAWSHDWFRVNYGDTEVSLSVNPRHTSSVRRMTVAQYISGLISDRERNLYMDQCPPEKFPGLDAYYETPEYCPRERELTVNLWVGPAGTILGFHKDNHDPYSWVDNMFVQLQGRKHIVLASPDQDPFMYQRPPDDREYWHSYIADPNVVDYSKYPLFCKATLLETIVNPGDMLFIPGNYWHYVRSLDDSISMSFWWNHHRMVDIVRRYLRAPERERAAFLEAHREAITMKDIEDFGGLQKFAAALNALGDHRVLISDLFAPSVPLPFRERPEIAPDRSGPSTQQP